MSRLPWISLDHTNEPLRAELDAVWKEVTSSSAFILGSVLEAFEEEWAAYCGTSHAVGVGSGTEAIELILRAMGVGPDDEVIVPASTFIATAAAVVSAGARPVFTDVDPSSLLITADHVRAALSPRTVAVLPVHLYGNPVDMAALAAVTEPAGIALVEDASQAHGAGTPGRRIGSLGLAAGFSHYPTKNLGAFGDAGTVTTDDPALATAIRRLRNHGRATQQEPDYEIIGRTGRLDALQAGVLSIKLRHLDDLNGQRRQVIAWYDELLPATARRITTPDPSATAPHLCVVLCTDRDKLRGALADQEIGSSIHYPDPVPRTTAFGRQVGYPVAEHAADSMVSLPLYPGMTRDDVERVCSVVAQVEAAG